MCYENSVFKNMTSFASVFHSVFGGVIGEGDDGKRKENRRLDFCMCFNEEREK